MAIFAVIQAGILLGMFILFRGYFEYYYVICIAITLFVAAHIIHRDTNPAYKIAWLIPIMLLPIFGGLFYLVYGKRRPRQPERRRLTLSNELFSDAIAARHDARDNMEYESPDISAQSRYITNSGGMPPYQGTQVEYFSLGEDMFESMLEDLKSAKRFIFMEFFIINEGEMWDSILDVLTEKAKQGLDVRLIYDDMGCLLNLPENYFKKVRKTGVKCCVFNRFNNIFSSRFNNRDHRKICIVDGNVGYTGGVNLADEYINRIERFGHWKDTAVKLSGEAVWSFTCMFLSTWCYINGKKEDFALFAPTKKIPDDGYVQPYGDSPLDDEDMGENVYMNIISRAKKYVYMTTPYLVIDSEMLKCLTTAAKSGLDIRIIMPAIPDKKIVFALSRSYYELLLKAGVRIFEYTPGFIHAKNFVSDDEIAVVGTINLDYRSLFLHFECAAWMYKNSAVQSVHDDFLLTQALCREVTLENVRTPLWVVKRFFMTILRIFAPLV